eukprot:1164810-Pleurochrysis_carterae.AAC.1
MVQLGCAQNGQRGHGDAPIRDAGRRARARLRRAQVKQVALATGPTSAARHRTSRRWEGELAATPRSAAGS